MDQSTSNRDLKSDRRYRSPQNRKHGNSLATPVKNTRTKPTPKSGKKTKNAAGLTDDAPPVISPTKGKSPRVKKTSTASTEERRLRRFRSAPPKSYRERLGRAISQRYASKSITMHQTNDTLLECLWSDRPSPARTRTLNWSSISSGQLVTSTGQLSGRSRPAVAQMREMATNASTSVTVRSTQ